MQVPKDCTGNILDNPHTCKFSSSLKNYDCKNMAMSSLTGNRKLLVPLLSLVVVGSAVASLATVMPLAASAQTTATNPGGNGSQITGTINAKQAAKDFLNSNLNATLVDAADVAEERVVNGTVIAGSLQVVQDYLVYNVTVADLGNANLHQVIIDPSTGKVITTSQGTPMGNMSAIGGQAAMDLLNRGMNVTLADAANAAERQIENGRTIAGSFEVVQGSAVFSITVANVDKGLLYKVVVDPNTGNAISTSEGMPMSDLGIKGIF
jgi:uncharacterized membrane protein YkoI